MPMTLHAPVDCELIIKKSRFLACVQPIEGRVQALAVVQALKAQHPEAVHVCWAMLAGGDSAAQDDGEPSGTAGRPMLEVLRHQDLEGVLATVVRYFGGVKLGAGGLVRAYTDAVAQSLLQAQKTPIVRKTHLACQVPYEFEGWLRRQAEKAEHVTFTVSHQAAVRFDFELPLASVTQWQRSLNDLGQGKLIWLDESSHNGPDPQAPRG